MVGEDERSFYTAFAYNGVDPTVSGPIINPTSSCLTIMNPSIYRRRICGW